MQNYIIVHALGNTANEYWYPWLKKQIEGKGFVCFTPTMPGLEKTCYKTWANEMDKIKSEINQDSVVIGHSVGSVFLAHYLISNKINVAKFIGVVSFNAPDGQGIHEDWDKINENFFVDNLEELKKYAKERICFYSPTDLYDFKKLDNFANTVDAEKVIIQNAGHFTAETGYGEKFEEILKYIY